MCDKLAKGIVRDQRDLSTTPLSTRQHAREQPQETHPRQHNASKGFLIFRFWLFSSLWAAAPADSQRQSHPSRNYWEERKGAGKKQNKKIRSGREEEEEREKKKRNYSCRIFFTTHWKSAAWPSFFISLFHHQLWWWCVCFWLDRLYRRPSDPIGTFLSHNTPEGPPPPFTNKRTLINLGSFTHWERVYSFIGGRRVM